MFGKKQESMPANLDKVDTIIGKSVQISGSIRAEGILRIEGKVEGEIQSSGDVIITESGVVKSDMKARNAVIAGTYNGNLALEGKLEIRATGKVEGDVKVDGFVVEDGRAFDGKCEMLKKENTLRPKNKDAKTLEESST